MFAMRSPTLPTGGSARAVDVAGVEVEAFMKGEPSVAHTRPRARIDAPRNGATTRTLDWRAWFSGSLIPAAVAHQERVARRRTWRTGNRAARPRGRPPESAWRSATRRFASAASR